MPVVDHPLIVSAFWAEGRGRPEFLATATPALSWQVSTDHPDWSQVGWALELERATGSECASATSPDSLAVPWPFAPLAPYETVRVRVSVTGTDGATNGVGAWNTLRTGPLTPADWQAAFITAGTGTADRDSSTPEGAGDDRGSTRFRTVLEPRERVASAILSVTAHGIYEATLNGEVVGDEVLTPGWTSFGDRLTFQSYDVTAMLRAGSPTVLGATVTGGWYGEHYGFDGNFARSYPGPLALSAQLRITYTSGTVETITTDDTWTATTRGEVVSAGIYPGQVDDARLADRALTDPATPFPVSLPVVVLDAYVDGRRLADPARLTPSFAPPVRRIEEVPAVEVFTSPSGKTLIDFGQNLVGWLRLRIDEPEGTVVTLRHAEVLENGELGVRPLRFARATDSYVSAGTGPVEWSPRFTFHGFRYAEVSGLSHALVAGDVTAQVVHNDMVRTGWLETSNAQLNQLHTNVLWGMRGNFLSLPTDCPQRDERLGWTGDIQVFTPTASYLYDVAGFLGSWLRDLEADQSRGDGVVPFVVPNPLPTPPMPAAAWGDAATLVPDALFRRYGDRAALERQYPSMRLWVETVHGLAGDDHLWTGGFQFGDWLDPSAPPENPAAAKTDPDIVATAYFYRSTIALADAAGLLGHTDDAGRYAALARDIRRAFVAEYVTPAGRLISDAHTAYAIAITFGLLTEPDQIARAGARLAELVRAHGYRIGTGFVGTPLICDALCRGGQSDVAYRLLLEEGLPSWLYPISMGATTIWERWDSMLPDGSINPGEMTSFNHYALGAVADWMQRTIGGIAPGSPGYRVVDVAPILGGGITSSRARLDTGYGTVTVDWELDGTAFSMRVTVPPNSRARVHVPGSAEAVAVGSGEHRFSADVAGLLADTRPQRLSLDTSLSDIVGDTEARTALEAFFVESGYFIGLGWTSSGKWKSGSPLRTSLIMFPNEQLPAIEALFTGINERRGLSAG
jgi:alpha-L-rhamnosidase